MLLEHSRAVWLPFKQPRRTANSANESFERNNLTEISPWSNIERHNNSNTSLNYTDNVPVTQNNIYRTCETLKVHKKETNEDYGCYLISTVEGEGKYAQRVEEQSNNDPFDLDDSSLWEEEWLGDADESELFDIITLRASQESAA